MGREPLTKKILLEYANKENHKYVILNEKYYDDLEYDNDIHSLENVKFYNINFTGFNLKHICFENVTFTNCNFKENDFTSSLFIKCKFKLSGLINIKANNISLIDSEFYYCGIYSPIVAASRFYDNLFANTLIKDAVLYDNGYRGNRFIGCTTDQYTENQLTSGVPDKGEFTCWHPKKFNNEYFVYELKVKAEDVLQSTHPTYHFYVKDFKVMAINKVDCDSGVIIKHTNVKDMDSALWLGLKNNLFEVFSTWDRAVDSIKCNDFTSKKFTQIDRKNTQ